MSGFFLTNWVLRSRKRKHREQLLAAAKSWPAATGKILKAEVVEKDDLAEGTAAQDRQVECPYYFSIAAGFFGGHLRSVPCSESEGRRLQKQVAEDAPVTVRYNPADPDEVCVLAADNVGTLPFAVWEG